MRGRLKRNMFLVKKELQRCCGTSSSAWLLEVQPQDGLAASDGFAGSLQFRRNARRMRATSSSPERTVRARRRRPPATRDSPPSASFIATASFSAQGKCEDALRTALGDDVPVAKHDAGQRPGPSTRAGWLFMAAAMRAAAALRRRQLRGSPVVTRRRSLGGRCARVAASDGGVLRGQPRIDEREPP